MRKYKQYMMYVTFCILLVTLISSVSAEKLCPAEWSNYVNFSRVNPSSQTVLNVSLYANFTIEPTMNVYGNFSSFRLVDSDLVNMTVDLDYNSSTEVRIWFQDHSMESGWNNYTLCFNNPAALPEFNATATFPDACFIWHANNLSVSHVKTGTTTPLLTQLRGETEFSNGLALFNASAWNAVPRLDDVLYINDTGCPKTTGDFVTLLRGNYTNASRGTGNAFGGYGGSTLGGTMFYLIGDNGNAYLYPAISTGEGGVSDNKLTTYMGWINRTNDWVIFQTYIDTAINDYESASTASYAMGNDHIWIGADPQDADYHSLFGEIDELQFYNASKTVYWLNVSIQNYNQSSFRIGASGSEGATSTVITTAVYPTVALVIQSNISQFNCTVSSDLEIFNFSLYVNAILEYTQYNNGSTSQQLNVTVGSLPQGTNTYFCRGYDDDENSDDSSTISFRVDSFAPTLFQAQNLSNMTTGVLPNSTYWWFNATDIELQSCYYNTSENATYVFVTPNTTITTNWTKEGTKRLHYCCNDTFGSESCLYETFNFSYFNITQYESSNTAGEGTIVQYKLQINMTGISGTYQQSTANLTWNNTNMGFTSKQVTANSIIFIKNLIIPFGSGNTTGTYINWTWNYSISNTTGALYDHNITSLEDARIYTISVDDCSALSVKILNFTIYDEASKRYENLSNVSIEINVLLSNFGNTTPLFNYSKVATMVNTTYICVPTGVLGFASYRMDVVTRYSSQGHVVEFDYIDAYNLSNEIMQNISLYDLLTTDSTSFLVNFYDARYLAVEGAIIDLQRYYVGEGIYNSVEKGKTDDGGQTTLHLVTEDVLYKFFVRKNGELLYESPQRKAICQATPCQINLYAVNTVVDIGEYENNSDIEYHWNFNKTLRRITFDFITRDGAAHEIFMNVSEWNGYDNKTICATSLTASSGTLTCDIPAGSNNATYMAYAYATNPGFVSYMVYSLSPDAMATFGYSGVIMTIFLVLILVLMAVMSSAIVVIIMGVVGLIIAGLLAIFNMGSIFAIGSMVIWLVIAGGILIWKLSQRRGA